MLYYKNKQIRDVNTLNTQIVYLKTIKPGANAC